MFCLRCKYFFTFLTFPTPPSSMDFPAIKLLCLEQRDCSLEDHTRDFLDLVCLTHYLAHLLRPLGRFCSVCGVSAGHNELSFTIYHEEAETQSPEPSPPNPPHSPLCTERTPEPTAAIDCRFIKYARQKD